MLIVADRAANSVEGFDEYYSRQTLTQTMIKQEETFRNQVYELHQLQHRNQKILMKEVDLNVSYEFNLNDESPFSNVGSSSKQLTCQSLETELEASREVPMTSSSRSMMNNCPQECRGTLNHEVSSTEGLKLSPGVGSGSWLEGVEQCQGDVSWKSISNRRQLFAYPELGQLDLNKAPLDETYISDISHNEVGGYGNGTFSTVLDLREPTNQFSNSSSTLTTSPSKDTGERSRQKISIPEWNVKKSKQEKQYSSHSNQLLPECTDSNRSPVSCKYDMIKEDLSSNSNVMKSQSFYPKKVKQLPKVDLLVERGAASLIYLSSSYNHEATERMKGSCNIEKEVPQSSSESYEAIVLKQEESDYCVSSTPYEVSTMDEKDYHGPKFKRGRRMKDFRKEILPGLASLSREEIYEDVKSMELAVRSREYKKCKSKNAATPSARSKRSRVSYVGR